MEVAPPHHLLVHIADLNAARAEGTPQPLRGPASLEGTGQVGEAVVARVPHRVLSQRDHDGGSARFHVQGEDDVFGRQIPDVQGTKAAQLVPDRLQLLHDLQQLALLGLELPVVDADVIHNLLVQGNKPADTRECCPVISFATKV